MSTEENPTDTTPATPTESKEWTPPGSQADLDRIIADRLNRERSKFADYDDLKAAAQRLTDIENANKTEAQKQAEALEAALQREAAATSQLLRYEVAADKGVPPGLVRFLTGTSREEIEEAATALLEAIPGAPGSPPRAPAEAAQTVAALAGQPQSVDMNEWMRHQRAR